VTSQAVVTGIGVVAPTGIGREEYWEATRAGGSAIAPITRFDASKYRARLAGQVPDFDPAERLPSHLLPQTDPMTQYALIAAEHALDDAGIIPEQLPEYAAGVVTAAAYGGFEFGQGELQNLWSKGGEYVSAYQSFAWFYAVNTGQISIRHGMRGPGRVIVTEQAGGLDAVAQARRQVRGGTPVVVTGGADSALCPWGWVSQIANGRVSLREEPHRAYLPFSREACGYVPGEGAALLIVEDADSAHARGARRYGEVAGYAATFDPPPGSGRPPGLERAIRMALADAEVTPQEVDVVFADAAGVPDLDAVEAAALRAVFGEREVPVTAPKTGTGRLASAGACLDLVAAFLALRDQVIPPTPNVTRAHVAHPIALVGPEPVSASLQTALVLARGIGGFNAAMVIRRAA